MNDPSSIFVPLIVAAAIVSFFWHARHFLAEVLAFVIGIVLSLLFALAIYDGAFEKYWWTAAGPLLLLGQFLQWKKKLFDEPAKEKLDKQAKEAIISGEAALRKEINELKNELKKTKRS
jgi:hypothetical protein